MNRGEESKTPGDYTYYSNYVPEKNEEAPKKKKKKGFFKNRGLVIILLDLLLLLMVFLLYQIFSRNVQDTVTVEGYHFSLSAFSFEDTVYVTLKIINKDAELGGSDLVTVYFQYGETKTAERTSLLPGRKDEEDFIRTTLNALSEVPDVTAVITMKNEERRISTNIRSE
jgi:hypothetical protein